MAIIHKVVSGETLWELARRYHITVDTLIQHNNLVSDTIYIGDTLVIPEGTNDREEVAEPMTYDVTTPVLPSIEGGFTLPEGYYSQDVLDDIALLARLVFAEARGEPYEGQVAVTAVLLNRLKHPQFPHTVYEAIYQPLQFETVANGTINNVPTNAVYLAVLAALAENDPSEGALFFWNPYKVRRSSWVWTRSIIKQIGNHVFAK